MKLSKQTIERLTKSKEGGELKRFLVDQIDSLDRVSDIPNEWTDRQKAIEMTARKLAAEKLTKILAPILGFKEPTKKEKPHYYLKNQKC